MESKIIIKMNAQERKKSKSRSNTKKLAKLVFCIGTVITTFCCFMSLISQGNPVAGTEQGLCIKIMLLVLTGCIAFGKAVFVATQRNS